MRRVNRALLTIVVLLTQVQGSEMIAQSSGVSWKRFDRRVPTGDVRTIAVNRRDQLFVGGYQGGVLRVTDTVFETLGRNFSSALAFCYAFGAGDTVYSGTYEGVCISGDNGESWERPQLLEMRSGQVFGICTRRPGEVIAATYKYGMQFSNDGGRNWHPVNSGLATTQCSFVTVGRDGLVYCGTFGGRVYVLDDAEGRWSLLLSKPQGGATRSVVQDRQGRWFASMDGAPRNLWRSTDSGASWTSVASELPGYPVGNLLVDSNDVLYATIIGGGIYASPDGGTHWTANNRGLDRLNCYSICALRDGSYVAGLIWTEDFPYADYFYLGRVSALGVRSVGSDGRTPLEPDLR